MLQKRILVVLVSLLILSAFSVGCRDDAPPPLALIGQPSIDFSYQDLTSGQMTSLSDHAGKIVIVEFWASWCVNCRQTVTDLQSYPELHPEWLDRVEVLTISIDEEVKLAERAIQTQDWNRTQNGWLDPEGGKNPASHAYASKGVPAAYVIGPDGMIVDAGNPSKVDLASIVNRLLAEG